MTFGVREVEDPGCAMTSTTHALPELVKLVNSWYLGKSNNKWSSFKVSAAQDTTKQVSEFRKGNTEIIGVGRYRGGGMYA